MHEAAWPEMAPADAHRRVGGSLALTINHALPGMAHAKVVRSTVPHARLLSVDVAEARTAPGVIAVLTGRDLADLDIDPYFGGQRDDQPVLAIDRVRYSGEPVALIVAVSDSAAADAVDLVDIDYEELPVVSDAVDAMAPGAPVVHDEWPDNDCGTWRLRHGDVERGFAQSDRVFSSVYTSPSASHVPMEPHVALADFSSGRLEVWTSSQAPYMVHTALKKMFGLPDESVRVVTFDLGGAYGAKGGVKIEPLVACASAAIRRPIRLVLSRAEVFQTIAKHAAHITIETGVKGDGTLVARRVNAVYNAGAYAVSSPIGSGQAMTRAPGPYRIANIAIDCTARYTNTVPTGPFRGAMTSQVCWAYEQQMDEIAAGLGIDPVEIRRRNLLVDGDRYATGEEMHDVHFSQLLDEVATAIDWDAPPAPTEPAKARGKGVAVMLKSTLTPTRSEAKLQLTDDGRLEVLCSSVEMGQGARATLTQMASAFTGVPTERITVPSPDTDLTPWDATTSSSRTTFSMGSAIKAAAEKLRVQLGELASHRLEVGAEDLEFADGRAGPVGAPLRAISYSELLRGAGLTRLVTDGVFQSEGGMTTLDRDTGQGRASIHWHEGAVGVEIEVDLDTGSIRILNCHGTSYAGRVVSRVRVRQQNEGNIIFGLGQALFEELIYDGGQLINPNLSDYMIPSIIDIPDRLTSSAIESDDPDADIHGVGEMTVPCLAPAIGNALHAATGVRIKDLPMTPEKVLRALRDGGDGTR
jgi:CO/xanthine dehydrogenase Mo-binding subunit